MSDAPHDIFDLEMDDGANIKIRRGGNPSGTRLFLSNGNGFAIDGYRVFWEPLLSEFDLILFDMRNHGRNQPTGADGHHYFQMARDLGSIYRGVAERLGNSKSVGVFHSMSARAAMKHAAEMEWVWQALVLFDPPSVPPRGHAHYEAMRNFELKLSHWAAGRQDVFNSPEELRDLWAKNRAQGRWAPQAREDMARAVLRPDENAQYTLSCRRELESLIYLAALSLNLWPVGHAIGGPVKLIVPDPSTPGVPPTGATNIALAKEGEYEFETVEDSGHLLQIEQPEACRSAMLTFLRNLTLA